MKIAISVFLGGGETDAGLRKGGSGSVEVPDPPQGENLRLVDPGWPGPLDGKSKAHRSGNCGELSEKVALKITLTGLYHIKGAMRNGKRVTRY
jgi:hypothetical protein